LITPSKVKKNVGSVTVLYGSLTCLAWQFFNAFKTRFKQFLVLKSLISINLYPKKVVKKEIQCECVHLKLTIF